MNMGPTSGLLHPKPRTRKAVQATKDREEAKVRKTVRGRAVIDAD